MWVARNKDNSLKLFLEKMPVALDPVCGKFWMSDINDSPIDFGIKVEAGLLPEVTFEMGAVEVTLALLGKK